jgi:hypothetical protein
MACKQCFASSRFIKPPKMKENKMSMYQLNVDFDPADLAVINAAGELVTITKQTAGSSHGATVAWVAFNPLSANTVTWQDQYTMYASRTALQGGATISMMSQTDALETKSLPFTTSGLFGSPDPSVTLPLDSYGLENQYTTVPSMVFGLAQEANVTGTAFPASPINANIVPMNQNAVFQPLDIIQVFVQANTDNGMVLSQVSGQALTLTFGAGVNEITVKYNPNTGGFYQLS